MRDSGPLQHSFGEFSQLHVRGRRQPDQVEEPRHALAALRSVVAKKSRVVIEQLARGEIIVEIGLFGKIADLAVHPDVFDRTPADARGAGGGENKPHQKLQRGGLAGAVRAEKPEDFAVFHLKREVIERPAHPLAPEARRDNPS